ncbi:MAG: MipA/OmpV family protein [Deltaproteobacteria bacterium]|jgi:outer membrane scaffolding protein for murein synthesis (MipA/OmpV family)|nr:MipA/OmpV family protein [Deltaproteobacteria bacterium]
MKIMATVLAAAFFMAAMPAYAGEDNPSAENLEHKFSIGAMSRVKPEFEGSDSYEFSPYPILEYSNKYFFISTLNGAGINIINMPEIKAGPLVSYRFGRDEDDSDLLDGLGDVDGGLEVGAFFNWQFHDRLGTEIKFLHGLGDAKGFTADLAFIYNQPVIEDLTFALKAAAVFSDSKYNQQYFGITDSQSRRSGYEHYSPGSGIKHVSIRPGLKYTFFEDYTVGVFYEYKRLTDSVADSSLVKRGSANQSSAGVSLSWSF